GYDPTAGKAMFRDSDFVSAGDNGRLTLRFKKEIQYEDKKTSGIHECRLIEHHRTLYRRNDLAGALPPGRQGVRALTLESYKLAFTPGLLDGIFVKSSKLTLAELKKILPADRTVSPSDNSFGGYVDILGDAKWWIPSGRVFYSPHADDEESARELQLAIKRFFLPHRFRDPFGHAVTVAYDTNSGDPTRNHNLLLLETNDPLGNTVSAEQNYRVLQPYLVTDPNGNRSKAAFDALGFVAVTAVMG